jgi:tRNA dimethylallyltransferase
MKKIPLITIEGPTAVGKSALALQLARELNSELISADSRQVYRYLDIGTAKPTVEEQAEVKHHCIDIITPDQQYTAGRFAQDASAIAQQLHQAGCLPIVVGGTGFYVQSLLQGLAAIPPIPQNLRDELASYARDGGDAALYARLAEVDPAAAERISDRDVHKMLRALEVYEATGKTITQYWQEQQSRQQFSPFRILITDQRSRLYERINARVDAMVANGLIDEVTGLLTRYNETDPGMVTVGYRELYPYLRGQNDLASCLEEIKKNTRRYAKRQFTWYRRQTFDLTLEAETVIFSDIISMIKTWIDQRRVLGCM